VVEAPATLNAAYGFGSADEGKQRWGNEQKCWADVGEVGDEDRGENAGADEDIATG